MTATPMMLTVRIPLALRRRSARKTMVAPAPGVFDAPPRQDITLVKAVARAFRWRQMLETGRYTTVTELAKAEKINSSYVSRVLRLTLLAPEIVEAVLDGRQTVAVTLPVLMKTFLAEWEEQRNTLDVDPRGPTSPALHGHAAREADDDRRQGCPL